MYNVEIVCPLYNASNYIIKLHNNILKQSGVNIIKINYLLTESNDNTEEILINNNIEYKKINKEGFSHSLTREEALFNVSNKFAIMITQDIGLEDKDCFKKMIEYLNNNELAICYCRQVSNVGLDRYYRAISYPNNNYIHDYNSLLKMGSDACFCSDACCCYNVDIFKKINGYDNKKLNTNEDMYYAYKCLSNNLLVGYISDTYVIHSHKLSLKQTYNRYIEIGKFFKENEEIGKLKSSKKKYLKCILGILKRFDIVSLIKFPFDVMARFMGLKKGKK